MKLMNYKYASGLLSNNEHRGCFIQMVTEGKNTQVKCLNRQGTYKVKKNRDGYEITEKDKYKKRKKGSVLGSFLKIDGIPHDDNNVELDRKVFKLPSNSPPKKIETTSNLLRLLNLKGYMEEFGPLHLY